LADANPKSMAAGDCFWIAFVASVVFHLGLTLTLWVAPMHSGESSALPVEFCTVWDDTAFPESLPPVVAMPLTPTPPAGEPMPEAPAGEVIQATSTAGPDEPKASLSPGSARTGLPAGSQEGKYPTNDSTVFFDLPATGKRIVFVIDRSTSMGLTGALNAAKHALRESIRHLPVGAAFQVIAYNRAAEPLLIDHGRNLAPATSENKERAEELIDALRAEGGSAHLPALKRALSFRPDTIYFLSDANGMTVEEMNEATRLNHDHAVIHTIELTTSRRTSDSTMLRQFANANRGEYRSVDINRSKSQGYPSFDRSSSLR
jgi:Ca-activated chloride channel family protein